MHYCTSFKEQDKIEHFRCCLRLRKEFRRIYFAVIWIFLLLVTIAFFFLSPTTKSLSTERAFFNKVIVLIIVCFGSYRFVPFYVRFNRRNWYKKILPEGCASLYVQISASHLEFCRAAGKNITFIYKPQIKRGNEICLKKIRQLGKSSKQKMAYILWVRTSNLLT